MNRCFDRWTAWKTTATSNTNPTCHCHTGNGEHTCDSGKCNRHRKGRIREFSWWFYNSIIAILHTHINFATIYVSSRLLWFLWTLGFSISCIVFAAEWPTCMLDCSWMSGEAQGSVFDWVTGRASCLACMWLNIWTLCWLMSVRNVRTRLFR